MAQLQYRECNTSTGDPAAAAAATGTVTTILPSCFYLHCDCGSIIGLHHAVCTVQAMVPAPRIDMFRLFVFINELRELPPLEVLAPHSEGDSETQTQQVTDTVRETVSDTQ